MIVALIFVFGLGFYLGALVMAVKADAAIEAAFDEFEARNP